MKPTGVPCVAIPDLDGGCQGSCARQAFTPPNPRHLTMSLATVKGSISPQKLLRVVAAMLIMSNASYSAGLPPPSDWPNLPMPYCGGRSILTHFLRLPMARWWVGKSEEQIGDLLIQIALQT